MAYTVAVGKAANAHETEPRRNVSNAKAPVVRPPGYSCDTVYEFAMEAFGKGGDRPGMAWRELLDVHEETKMVTKRIDGKEQQVEKKWQYFELSEYRHNSYRELSQIMHDLGRGLVEIGVEPGQQEKLHIYASTSHKWMKMFLGAQSQNIPVVTAYDTLGESGLLHSVVQTETSVMFTDNHLLQSLIRPLQKTPKMKYIIYNEPISEQDRRHNGQIYQEAYNALNKIKEVRPDIQFYSFDDILKLGREARDKVPLNHPKADDVSCIMYTSGSTGDPKGVVLTHANIVAGVGGVSDCVGNIIGQKDRIIAFLPLAHIFELAFELISFYWGGVLGYATVKTLTSNSVRNCQGDLQEFKPTVMVGVAAVWETVRKGILAQIAKLPTMSQKIFWTAYHAKIKMKRFHIPGGDSLGNLVFKKIKQATGGDLRFTLNGGSPISVDAQEFITNLICPMLIGYGLTETVANTCVLQPNRFELGVAGDLTGAVTVKLVDVDELGYLAKNNQGEIWIKGASVMVEYYKNKEETEKVMTKDGWFMTGDIGEWTANGHLKVIDRKKNLVKTQNGEYIALEKLESVYRSNPYVQNICVYADQSKVKPVGIIVPNLGPLGELAKEVGVAKDADDVENHLDDPKLQKALLDRLLKTGRSQGLAGIELLEGVVLFHEEWTPQNGFVTSAQKLKRKDILNEVKEQVDKVYGN
ncbi:long-chain fatty acid-CoA ligase FAA1 TDEL_0B01020 [Torulaspora delbrueckii]|uniref:AMP-dependent synthetase/ligase domain-containing protein n=1 Tax=Torulaspora delbrueckii TaxID=4950 RepID=G8ZNN7_TORDE|nr:hypothetical protein TDEL_0B01020 [Torulaspora delbrueckii]CCE90231.1 hypothetical protein TDEL_0B01020 [Torulaspora delbrueckii]